jgi:Smg protein
MKEDMFDVLIYLFENYLDREIEMFSDADAIATELIDAGFNQPEVNKAFDWLESLTADKPISPVKSSTFRIFSDKEQAVLDLECQDFLLFLEHNEILTPSSRELVIDRAMALQNENIDLEKLKWLVLMVLLSLPDDVLAYSRMEDIVYDLVPASLH